MEEGRRERVDGGGVVVLADWEGVRLVAAAPPVWEVGEVVEGEA